MQKHLVFSLLGLFLAPEFSGLAAQKPVVKISPEFKLAKSLEFQDHLFTDATGNHYVYFYKTEGGGMFSKPRYTVVMEKYSPQFKLDFTKEYQSNSKNTGTLGLKYFQGKFAWLVSEENKKEDYVRYVLAPIGLDGKVGKPVDVAKIKYEDRSDIPKVEFSVSRDSSKMLVQAVSDNDDEDRKLGLFVSVFDQSYTPVWTKNVLLPGAESQVAMLGSLMSNDGNAYFLAKIYEDHQTKETKRKKGKKAPAYEVALFQVGATSDKPKEIKLDLADGFVRGASLANDAAGNLLCSGFYSNTKSGVIQGVFFLKLAPDGSVLASNKKAFTTADLRSLGKKNTDDDDGDEGLEDSFKFTDFLVKSDGSSVVVAEENYSYTYSSYDPYTHMVRYYTTYYSKDIVFFTIAADGNIQRVTVIPKNQVSNTDFFQGYSALIKDKDVAFFYNEDEDNLKKPVNNPSPKKVKSFNESVAVMTTLHDDGELERKKLFEAKDLEALFVAKNSRQIGPKTLFFVSQKFKLWSKSNFHMGTVELP